MKSASYLNWRQAQTGSDDRTMSAELYTAAGDWSGGHVLNVVNGAGTTLYAGLDPYGPRKKHRASALKVCPAWDNVFPNGDFESALSGWTASGAGFAISRVTDRIIYGTASGRLQKANTQQVGMRVDHAMTFLSADVTEGKTLYVCLEGSPGVGYTDGLFKLQVLKGSSVVVETSLPLRHGPVEVSWPADGTTAYTLRFVVGVDADRGRATDKVRNFYVDNIYAGPKQIYSVARKALITMNDTSDSPADRLTTFDIDMTDHIDSWHWGADDIVILDSTDFYFDYDAVDGSGVDAANLIVEESTWLLGGHHVWIDGVQQGLNVERFRLDGKHTIKVVYTSILGNMKGTISTKMLLMREV